MNQKTVPISLAFLGILAMQFLLLGDDSSSLKETICVDFEKELTKTKQNGMYKGRNILN